MKKITLGFSILAASAIFMFGCKKEKDTEIEPDMEFQSSVDISYALQVITDVDMVCSYSGENDVDFSRFFRHVPTSVTPSVVTVSRDTVLEMISVSFNNAVCRDGHKRDGTIAMSFKNANPNAKYYRDFAFAGKVLLINYKVDDWKISAKGDLIIRNLVAPVNYSPTTTNLNWSITGDFYLKHPTDSSKDMHCYAALTKTLTNTSNKLVFPPSKQAAINWSIATVEYKGTMYGETSRNVPFKFAIDEARPLLRDFVCSPDKVYGTVVGTNSVTPRIELYTPFTGGAASFTTSTKYPRVIYYGPEDPSQPPSCDNTGAVMIKGISYPIDFKKVYK